MTTNENALKEKMDLSMRHRYRSSFNINKSADFCFDKLKMQDAMAYLVQLPFLEATSERQFALERHTFCDIAPTDQDYVNTWFRTSSKRSQLEILVKSLMGGSGPLLNATATPKNTASFLRDNYELIGKISLKLYFRNSVGIVGVDYENNRGHLEISYVPKYASFLHSPQLVTNVLKNPESGLEVLHDAYQQIG